LGRGAYWWQKSEISREKERGGERRLCIAVMAREKRGKSTKGRKTNKQKERKGSPLYFSNYQELCEWTGK